MRTCIRNFARSLLIYVVYYSIVTPIGLARKILGMDHLKMRGRKDTYWIKMDKAKDKYDLQQPY